MRVRDTGRLMLVAVVTELATGIGFFVIAGASRPGPYAELRPFFPLISLTMLLGGVAGAGLLRFGLGYRVKQALAVLPAAPLVLTMALGAGHGLSLASTVFGPLALALLVAPWLPEAREPVEPTRPAADVALWIMALVEAAVGVHYILDPHGALATLVLRAGLAVRALGVLGLVGSAGLILPESGRPWGAVPSPLRRQIAAILPLLLVANAIALERFGALGACLGWFVALVVGERALIALRAADTTAEGIGALEAMLEGWGWVLVLVAVALALLTEPGATAMLFSTRVFVLAVLTYNVAAFGALPRLGTPERRVSWHVTFLTVAIVGLRVTMPGGLADQSVLLLLVVAPVLAMRHLGQVAINRLCAWTVLLMVVGDLVGWARGIATLEASLVRALVDVLVLLAVVLTVARDARTARSATGALVESEARFHALANSAADGIIIARPDGRILYWNEGAHTIFGYTQAEAVGLPAALLIAEADRPTQWAALEDVLRRARPATRRPTAFAARRKDGGTFPAEVAISTWHAESGRLFSGIVRDISEHLRTEADLRELRLRNELILNATAEGIVGLDLEGRATFANAAALRLTGYSLAEVLGNRPHDLVHRLPPDGDGHALEDCPLHRARLGGLLNQADTFGRRHGGSVPVQYAISPMQDGEAIIGGVLSFTDISDRLAVDRMKNEFVSVVSHELRTPLTAIHGALGLLSGGLVGELPAQGRRMLEIATHNTERLVRLTNDILDIERMNSGVVDMRRQVCDGAALVTQAVDVMRPLAETTGVSLVASVAPVPIWADPDRILQVLTNLLSNAIKFSPPGTAVTLAATATGGGGIGFAVTDQGRGIPPDKLQTIFGRFAQVDASDSREKGGVGLGLAICQTIVAQHGGTIWAESTPGRGSTFRFTLPAAPPGEATAAGVGPAPGTATVLVCDDEPMGRGALVQVLREHGYHVVSANSGPEAVEWVARLRPDAILLDLQAPGMAGSEILGAIRGQQQTSQIPVIIVNAIGSGEVDEIGAHVAAWLGKPPDGDQVVPAVGRSVTLGQGTARVLVVEDDADLAEVLIAQCSRHGVTAFRAASGAEAIRLSQELEPDLLVLDVALPDGDGYAVVDWLRRHRRLSQVPLAVYSGQDLDDEARQRLRLGITEFATKAQVSPEQFAGRIAALLQRIVPAAGGSGPDARAADPDHR